MDTQSQEDDVTASILVIGDEILSGRTKDKNIGTIADRLTDIGVDLKEVRIVGDDADDIVIAVNALRTKYTYVFTTGGIGPTHDDITIDCIAKAFGVDVIEHAEAVTLMTDALSKRGLELTPVRRRMARAPQGSTLLIAPTSAAPGFRIDNVFILAGVPMIMEEMLSSATDQLSRRTKINSVSVTLWKPESDIAELFSEHQAEFPAVAMGSYPAFVNGRYRTELVLRSRDAEGLRNAYDGLITRLKARNLDVTASD